MKGFPLQWVLMSAISLCLFGCAQISSPTGGPVDEDPPKVVEMVPYTDQINVRPSSLRISFDEFVALKNPQQQLVISPPIPTKPTFRIRGKEVQLEMDAAAFQDSTTYVFSFGKGIVDLHESNPAVDLKWAFSTGPTIDSLALNGRVLDRMTGEVQGGLRILLFQDPFELDSILTGSLPDAIGVTNEEGMFEIDHLSRGHFFPLALDDLNSNYKWDAGEYLAFDSTSIASGDTMQRLLLGFESPEKETLRYIESCNLDSTGAIRILAPMEGTMDSEEWAAVFQGDEVHAPWEREVDSVFMWVDSALIHLCEELNVVWMGQTFNDTSNVRLERRPRRQSPMLLEKLPRSSAAQSGRILTFDRAVQLLDYNQWMLISDADTLLQSEFEMRDIRNDSLSRKLHLKYKEVDGAKYHLIAFPNALTNPLGDVQPDTLRWKWNVHPSDFFGELKVDLSNLPGPGWFTIGLGRKTPVEIRCSGDTTLVFSRLDPGSYKLGYEWDVNDNDVWEMGDLKGFEVPEPYFYPQENPTIRSNWLVEWSWDLSSAAGTD